MNYWSLVSRRRQYWPETHKIQLVIMDAIVYSRVSLCLLSMAMLNVSQFTISLQMEWSRFDRYAPKEYSITVNRLGYRIQITA